MRDTQPQSGPLALDPQFQQYLPQRLVNFSVDETDIITGSKLTRVGAGTFTKAAGTKGIGLQFGDGTGTTYLTAAVRAETRTSFTMIWVGQLPSGFIGQVVRDSSVTGGSVVIWNNAGTFDVRVADNDFTAAGSWPALVDQVVVVTVSATAVKVFANGVLLISGGAPGGTAIASPWYIHRAGQNAQGDNATTRLWGVFAKPFPDNVAKSVSANPWQLFKSPQRMLFAPAVGGPATYSYTASGGFILSGTAPAVRGITKTATGGATFSGSAAQSRGAVKSASGGILFAGTAALARGKAYATSGGLTLSGAATVLRGLAKTASGGILFAGASPVSFHSSVQQLIVNPVGGIVISGASTVARSVRYVASGGLSLAGHAATTFFPPVAGFLGGLLPEFVRRRRRR